MKIFRKKGIPKRSQFLRRMNIFNVTISMTVVFAPYGNKSFRPQTQLSNSISGTVDLPISPLVVRLYCHPCFSFFGPRFCLVSHRALSLVTAWSLLFSLYINDISTDIDSEIRLFADDCVCYREIKDTEDTLKLQKDIVQLGCWARKWSMRFQPVKCNMMQITRKRIKKIHASYTLEGSSKMSKASSILGSLSQMICDGIHMSAIFALRLIGPLASLDEIFTLVHKR